MKPTRFNPFISALLQNPRYRIARSEDIHGQPRACTGIEAEKLCMSNDELLIFEIERKWEYTPFFFFLPWWREIPSNLHLVGVAKKPDAHDKPLQVMSFDFGFFNHLQIMQENGVVFELKMSDTTSDTNVMGYSYNSARAMYEPVLKEK